MPDSQETNMAGKMKLVLLLVAVLVDLSYQISQPSDPTYQAGVVEFPPSKESLPSARAKDNVKRMKEIIESDNTKDLDILVFPEYALTKPDYRTYVPDPKLEISPCEAPNYAAYMVEISCAARSRGLYVVINVAEKAECAAKEVCDESGLKTYNTNVVFDRKGRVISRYRKSHLYGAEWYSTNVLDAPEHAIFETDFGVTFGHFICFDMLFYDPAMVLIRERNITDIIYPTYWFSELPFLTAVQLQEGFAYANNVNLLAADASVPDEKNTGSGIYAGKFGRLQAAIFEEPTTLLLKATVPKHGSNYTLPPNVISVFIPQLEKSRFTKMSLLRDYNVDIFSTHLLDENFLTVNETLCHDKGFCCDFSIKRVSISTSVLHTAYRFRLAAYLGTQTTHQGKDASELGVCSLIACTGDELYTCGHIFPENILVGNKHYFETLRISGNFPNSKRRLIMPTSVDGQMMPVPVDMFSMTEDVGSNSTHVSIELIKPKDNILTFGVLANYYTTTITNHNLDPLRRGSLKSSASSIGTHSIGYIVGAVCCWLTTISGISWRMSALVA